MRIALIGYPLKKSLSRYIYKTISELLNIKILFIEIETKEPLKEIDFLKKEKFNGFFITIPYKKLFLEIVKKDEIVEKTKNINCIRIEDDNFIATNTDYLSLKYLLKRKNINISSKNATIIGSGSAALTSYALLKELGAEKINIIIRNLTKKNREYEFKDSNIMLISEIKDYKTDLIINATPLGMYYEFPEINFNFEIAIDFAYIKEDTTLIKRAKKDSKIFIEGKEILVMQAIYGLKHIIGIDIIDNYEEIYNAFLNKIKESV